MKLLPTLVLALLVACQAPVIAQQHSLTPPLRSATKAKPQTAERRLPRTGLEAGLPAPVSVPAADNLLGEQLMGYTFYDQQTNSSMANHLFLWDDGRVSGIWNQSFQASFNDRGTGYNKSDGSQIFASTPDTRVETVRAGFPAYDVTSTGEEWIVSHIGATPSFTIHYSHKADNATTWVQGDLPKSAATSTFGHLWPRIAVGGNDGQTLHIIALTTPVASANNNQAAIIDGLDGQLRYWRSTDGGANWDIQDMVVPGIDTAKWLGINGDAYSLDADGETVAILVSNLFGDDIMIKSLDNGSTWETPRVVHDFPLDRFGIDEYLYTHEDIAAYWDADLVPNNDSLAILSTDETGSVFVDPSGRVHVALPTLYIREDDLTDNQYTYYPGYNLGIIYWNDDMDDDDGLLPAYAPDLDGDTLWGNANSQIYAAGYGEGFCAIPTMGLDADGRLYITYSANHELHFDEATNQHYRQPFITRSEIDDFMTWADPEPVLQNGVATDPVIVSLSEYYFPVMAKRVDDKVHIQFQHDYDFGISLRTTPPAAPTENSLEYVGFPTNLFTVGTSEATKNALELALMPNPASTGQTTVTFDLANPADTRLELYTVTGARLRTLDQGRLGAGRQQVAIELAGLNAGLYFLRVQAGNATGMRRLIVME